MKIEALGDHSELNQADIYAEQEGPHVTLTIEPAGGAPRAEATLTPGQAEALSDHLALVAKDAADYYRP